MKPYYEDANCTIYHGDCREVLPTISLIDLIVTSPPYNLGNSTGTGLKAMLRGDTKSSSWPRGGIAYGYDDHDDTMPLAAYEDWMRDCLDLMWNTLRNTGAIFFNHKPRPRDGVLWLPLVLVPEHMPIRQIITWDRGCGMNFNTRHYVPNSEWIIVIARPDWQLRSQAASGVGDVWRIPYEIGSEHPASFPLGVPAKAIETTAPRRVLDPFMGSGTTLRAAKNANYTAIGIDVSERYCEMAANRLAQEVLDFGATP